MYSLSYSLLLLIFFYTNFIFGQEKVDIKPIQINQIYLKSPDQLFYSNNTIYYHSIEQKYYPSRNQCLSSYNKQLKLIEESEDFDKDLICTPQNFNQTNLLKKCLIHADSTYTSLECHNKLFFILNKDMIEGIKQVQMPTNYTQNATEKGYYKLRISDYISSTQNILKISQSGYQTCYITPTFLQCLQQMEDGIFRPKDPLYIMEDQNSLSKLNNNLTRNLSDENTTSQDIQPESVLREDNSTQQSQSQKDKRKILTFGSISYQSNKSIILIVPTQSPDEDLHFISIHTEKSFYAFECQQSDIQFSTSQINFNMKTNKILDVQLVLNKQRGSVNAFLVTNSGIWIFEIQINFYQKTIMHFVSKIDTKIDIFSINRNIITIFNRKQSQISIYRLLEFSQKVQFVTSIDDAIISTSPKNSTLQETQNDLNSTSNQIDEQQNDFILRVFTDQSESKINKFRPAQYLIFLVNSKLKIQTIISLSEFQKSQKYLTPLHSIIQQNVDIQINFQINSDDFKNFTLAKEEIEYNKVSENEKSSEYIVDLQYIKDSTSKSYIIFSSNHAIYLLPICFPNNQLFIDETDVITSYTYNGCIPCEFSTYSKNINQQQCLKINNNSQRIYDQYAKYSTFELINMQDNCISQELKGPQCQTCTEFQKSYLPNEQNIKLIDQTMNQQFGQTVCQYQCEEKNSNQNYIKGTIQEEFQDNTQRRKLKINSLKQIYEVEISQNSQNYENQNNLEETLNYAAQANKTQQSFNLYIRDSPNNKIRKLDDAKDKATKENQFNKNKENQQNNQNNDQNSPDSQSEKELKNTATECIEKQSELEYNNFCSKFKDCYSCSYHPFCIFNPIERKCQKLNNYKQPTMTNFQQFMIQNFSESSKTLLDYQKYEYCNVIKHQKVCPFSQNINKYRGEFLFYKNQKKKDSKQLGDNKEGIEIKTQDGDGAEYDQVEQFQVCSWYVNTDKSYQDFDYEIKIYLDEGFIQGKDSLQATVGICHSYESEIQGERSNSEPCKLTKMPMTLNQSTTKWIKFGGGKFRFVLQFMEKAQIDVSKISITFMPVTNHDKQLIVVICIIVIISIFFLLIILLIFKNKILYCIRVKFNTLYFLDWEDNTELNNITIKQIIKRLEKQKLLKLHSKSSYHTDNQYHHTECSICLVDFKQADPLYVLVCSHIFHQHCFEEWVKVQFNPVTCPNCKISLNNNAFTLIEMQKQNKLQNKNAASTSQNQSQSQNSSAVPEQISIEMENNGLQVANNNDSAEGQEIEHLINANTIFIS
ncbi:C3HC4 type (RING finger) zinc finger protein (macronuclear) [Tetrahymena thermophila SB210]|uniref:C3HC4 type (RING finger) zinc finger protein n=1 Tax=Tetrahymena thermophila (strain SB210) TaxID=312017 RepID=Q22BU9_TETTS|nr:C3HC4 type (RING finger) zinc finger protein [Tetrahymena thermophila SB210]EAR82751.2 C3HC4 type (RING finger) zinc finger protein [Tetrahymena thermophila SB210]|eukprot:XP_001030414.2 C3HC4 type (RING finger) zinc finger protein [Tetrahymena thermophila SB210]